MKPKSYGKWIALLALALGALATTAPAVADGYRGHYHGKRGYGGYGYGYGYGYGRGYGYRGYYGGAPYYYGAGWYRPYGPRVVVVAPPIGFGVSILPPYYSTYWYGGVPYYYADRAYYRWYPERREYVVTQPPAREPDAASQAPPDSGDIFVYPKNGQTEAQKSDDRYECHAWAVQQSGFDPTRQGGGVEDSQADARRADYRRAEVACLEGRGYSVK